MQENDWFCLIHISSSSPVYSLLIARTLYVLISSTVTAGFVSVIF